MKLELAALDKRRDEEDMEETSFKAEQNNIYNITKELGLTIAKEKLDRDNPLFIMSEYGANTKGDGTKNGQMIGCVGQQFTHGEMLKQTLSNNTPLSTQGTGRRDS